MCVEFCWCLCIHKVSFRGACYFFASVHSYEGVSRLLSLIFTNVILRTYFMDSRKTDLDMPDAGSEDSVELLAKSLYYLATTITAFMIFRAVEKEWRNLMQWTGVVFLTIEVIALGLYFVLHPNSYASANCLLTLSARIVFVFFYVISLILYVHQLSREEAESEWKFQQSEWEPRFLSGPSSSIGGRSPGGHGIGILSGFGTLGFGENTIKWLEAEKAIIPHPKLIEDGFQFNGKSIGKVSGPVVQDKDANNNNNNGNDGKFEVRYEVCKSIGNISKLAP